MKQIYFLLITTLLFSTACEKGENNSEGSKDSPKLTGRRLRTIMDEKFPDKTMIVGISCGLWAFAYECGDIVDTEFNYVTPENDFKQKIIHPNNTDWNANDANEWISHAEDNNQIIRMHCPIGPQASDWTKENIRTSLELEQNMTDFLTAVCTTFNTIGHVKYMDVVNETVRNGSWFESELGVVDWENPWTKIGYEDDKNKTPLYIKKAFEIANQYAPNIKQLYNHHEEPGKTVSWDLIKETILQLKADGLRIDAIGWQAHVDNGWATEDNLNLLGDLIDWTHQNSMEFHVTEASSFIKNDVSDAELTLQAETYSKIFRVLLEKHANGNVGWNTWHLTDAYTYRDEYFPALFDEDNNPKPAYFAIQKELEDF